MPRFGGKMHDLFWLCAFLYSDLLEVQAVCVGLVLHLSTEFCFAEKITMPHLLPRCHQDVLTCIIGALIYPRTCLVFFFSSFSFTPPCTSSDLPAVYLVLSRFERGTGLDQSTQEYKNYCFKDWFSTFYLLCGMVRVWIQKGAVCGKGKVSRRQEIGVRKANTMRFCDKASSCFRMHLLSCVTLDLPK